MTRVSQHPSQAAGFDFTAHIRLVCADMVARLPELRHIDLSRVAISFAQARKSHAHGMQASLTPLRFEGGARTTVRRKQRYTIERVTSAGGIEMLYILSFYLPRFLNHSMEEKIATIVHELWHINPDFNGDLRRYDGRCYAHGPSHEQYEAEVQQLADAWWSLGPAEPDFAFLRLNFSQLQRKHGRVYGMKIPSPKLIPED